MVYIKDVFLVKKRHFGRFVRFIALRAIEGLGMVLGASCRQDG